MHFLVFLAILVGCDSNDGYPRTVEGIRLSHDGTLFRASDGKFEMQFPSAPNVESEKLSPQAKVTVLGAAAPHYSLNVEIMEADLKTPVEVASMQSGTLIGANITDPAWTDIMLAGRAARFARGTWHSKEGRQLPSRTWFVEAPTQKRFYVVNLVEFPEGVSDAEATAIASRLKLIDP